MTWAEFRKTVEETGVKDNDIVLYIDTGSYPSILDVTVDEEADGERTVTITGR